MVMLLLLLFLLLCPECGVEQYFEAAGLQTRAGLIGCGHILL